MLKILVSIKAHLGTCAVSDAAPKRTSADACVAGNLTVNGEGGSSATVFTGCQCNVKCWAGYAAIEGNRFYSLAACKEG